MNKDDAVEKLRANRQKIVDLLRMLQGLDAARSVLAEFRRLFFSSLDFNEDGADVRVYQERVSELLDIFESSISVIESDQAEYLIEALGKNDEVRSLSLLFRVLAFCHIERIMLNVNESTSDYVLRITAFLVGIQGYEKEDIRIISNQLFFWVKSSSLVINADLKRKIISPLEEIKSLNETVSLKVSSIASDVDRLENTKNDLIDRADHYVEIIKEHKIALGIDALAASFEVFRGRKSEERRVSMLILLVLFASMVIVPVAIFAFGEFNQDRPMLPQLVRYMPFVSLEIILIYFFRVSIIQFNSIQAQLLQLDLRIAASKFVQEFSSFKKEAETDVSKFEALIFSGIVAEMEKTPSTFDGLQEIVSSIKKG